MSSPATPPSWWRRTMRRLQRLTWWRMRWVLHDYRREHRGEAFEYRSLALNQAYAPWTTDAAFTELYARIREHTLVDITRCYELWDLVHQLAKVPGDAIEVGVWRGGTGCVIATAMQRVRSASQVFLCDTFTGVVKAGERDPSYRGGEHDDTSLGHVQALVQSLHLHNVVLLQGIFPEQTATSIGASPVAFCHIDVDVYQSALDIVEWLLPRLSPGGVIVFDDYGCASCVGITSYVNALKQQGQFTTIYNLNGHAVLIKRS